MRVLLPALALLLAATPAEATHRHAIVIGANVGGPSHEPLLYAETDAARMAAVLRDVGGFAPGDVVLLTRTDAAAVRQALIELNARIREQPGPSMIFVYYSGHGDARSLHLYGTQLDLAEFKNLVSGSPARSRVLVVDACESGAITRVKGGTPVPEFDIVFERGTAEGLAILTSSAASEDSQESDELGASIFTHHLVSALLGAGDRDGDGLVTLGEAFSYSAERTLAVSSSTRVGPQHPTYRFDLGGRDDLVLSRLTSARNMGLLALPESGTWVVRDAGPRGAVVAEVVADAPGARVALRPGRYAILRRGRDHLLEGEVEVANGRTTALSASKLRRIDYAQAVRKGGEEALHRPPGGGRNARTFSRSWQSRGWRPWIAYRLSHPLRRRRAPLFRISTDERPSGDRDERICIDHVRHPLLRRWSTHNRRTSSTEKGPSLKDSSTKSPVPQLRPSAS